MSEASFLDNYSPFGNDTEAPRSIPQISVEPENRAAPSFNGSSEPGKCPMTPEQLAAYEEEIHLLELQVNNREQQVREARQNGGLEPAPNWPKCYPIVHFDIEEVPQQFRGFVNEAFFGWIVMAVSFLMNWIGCMCLISVSDESIGSPGSKIALSSLYFFVVVPLALDLDAMSIYKVLSMPTISTFSYLKVFLALGFTIIFKVVMFLGLDDSGSVGLISTIDLFSYGHSGIGIWGVFVTIAFAASGFFDVKLFGGLWKFYRGTEEGINMGTNVKRSVAEFMVERLK